MRFPLDLSADRPFRMRKQLLDDIGCRDRAVNIGKHGKAPLHVSRSPRSEGRRGKRCRHLSVRSSQGPRAARPGRSLSEPARDAIYFAGVLGGWATRDASIPPRREAVAPAEGEGADLIQRGFSRGARHLKVGSRAFPAICFAVQATAECDLISRVPEKFAKRGLIPAKFVADSGDEAGLL